MNKIHIGIEFFLHDLNLIDKLFIFFIETTII